MKLFLFYTGGFMKIFLILILCMIGAADIIKAVIVYFCKDSSCRYDVILRLDDNCKNPDSAIRTVILYHKWTEKNTEIFCIYTGSNEETRAICKKVCNDYVCAHFLDNELILSEISSALDL